MEARIRSDNLKLEFEALAQRHLKLEVIANTKPASQWQSEARKMIQDLTEMLRKVNTRNPLGSEERLFLVDAKGRVLGYLSYWDRLLKR